MATLMTSQINAKVTRLGFLGCADIDVCGESIAFNFDGESLRIDWDDFSVFEEMPSILKKCQKYTCCGDLIDYDGDSDICPSCGEHT